MIIFSKFIQIDSFTSTDSDIDVGILENLGIVEEEATKLHLVSDGDFMLPKQERLEKLKTQEKDSLWQELAICWRRKLTYCCICDCFDWIYSSALVNYTSVGNYN